MAGSLTQRSKAPIGYARLPPDRARRPRGLGPRRRDGRRRRGRPPAAAQGYMQDVTLARQDSIRLELLVGILASQPTKGRRTRSSRRGRSLAAALRRRRRQLRRDERRPALDPLHDRQRAESWTSRGSPAMSSGSRTGRSSSRTSRGSLARSGSQTELDQHRIGSCVDVPLFRNGVAVGVLWFNSREPRDVGRRRGVGALPTSPVSLRSCSAAPRRRAATPRRARPAQPRRDPAGGEPFGRALPDAAALDEGIVELMRVLGEATGVRARLRLRERRRRRRRAVRAAPAPAGSDRRHADSRRPSAGASPAGAPLPALGRTAGRGRGAQQSRPRAARTTSASRSRSPARSRSWPCRSSSTAAWWGFIGFEDCEHERDWSPAETDALRAAAGIVAAAINRERAERDLRRRDAMLEAVSHARRLLVAAPSWRDAADDLLRAARDASGASRAYLFESGVPRRRQANREPAVRVGR